MPDAALPVLYSFRRCPYAMRARLALGVSAQAYEHREILLRNKPPEMLAASPKGTVPVLVLQGGEVIDESLDIMRWALNDHDPERWLQPERGDLNEMLGLIEQCDGPFKQALDAYKYARAPDVQAAARARALAFVALLNERLSSTSFLFGATPALADAAIAPFVRQFAGVQPDWFARQAWSGLHRWLGRFTDSALFVEVMQKRALWLKN